MSGLTARQRDALVFIQKYTTENDGIPPSFDDIKSALGLGSKSGVHRIVTALEERGRIRRLPQRARAIEIVRGLE